MPITLIARLWPRLPRPWLITGADQGDARSHFTRRARGQRSVARGGDLFRGRTVALDRIRGWLTTDQPPGQPLVLTGQPGAGKSAVLARAALGLETAQGGPGLGFHARSATIGDFLTALADLTGVDTPASVDEMVTSLAELPGQPPIRVVLDALDEAASDLDRWQITEALAELAVLPGLRVAVATRPLAAGNPYMPSELLAALEHVRGSGSLARWQDRLTPLWSRLIPGCHLGRDTAAAVERAGFTIQRSELFDPFPRWVPARPMLQAIATPAT